jgi:hypothetical protein
MFSSREDALSKFQLIEEPISPNPLIADPVESSIAKATPVIGFLGPTWIL